MKTLVLMTDDRPESGDDYNSWAAKINRVYASRHGYDFQYTQVSNVHSPRSINIKRHPSWAKLPATMDALGSYDRVVYIDSDCIFKNQSIGIDEYLATSRNIYLNNVNRVPLIFLNDLPWKQDQPCAGFFIATKEAFPILKDWWWCNRFPLYDTVHTWEQYVLQNYTLHRHRNSIDIIHDWMFEEKPNQFLRHVASHQKHLRPTYFKDFWKNNFAQEK